MKILFVENHQLFAETVVAQFLARDAVTIVANVFEAFDLIRTGRFDAVLVDYDLDDFKGDAFVRRLRSSGSTIPIVAVSARETGNAVLVAAGADAVCHKADFRSIRRVLERVRSDDVGNTIPSLLRAAPGPRLTRPRPI